MITLPKTTHKASDINLSAILNSTTKVNMLTVLNMFQKYYLVVTYCDEEKGEWHMLMPKELRESLSGSLPFFLDLAMKGGKGPSTKELRMMAMMNRLLGESE